MSLGGYTSATLAPVTATYAGYVATTYTDQYKYVLLTLGVNDTLGGLPVEATFKTDYAKVLDDIHSALPAATVLVALPWARDRTADCATVSGWIADVISTRADFAAVAIDEAVLIENGDNGVTYTDDGVHPNAAGIAVLAPAWKTAMGY